MHLIEEVFHAAEIDHRKDGYYACLNKEAFLVYYKTNPTTGLVIFGYNLKNKKCTTQPYKILIDEKTFEACSLRGKTMTKKVSKTFFDDYPELVFFGVIHDNHKGENNE